MGVSCMIALGAVVLSLYLFPKQDVFWAYLSVHYFVSLFCLVVCFYLSTKKLRQLVSYVIEVPKIKKILFLWILLYLVILIILCCTLPIHSMFLIMLFGLYQWRVWKEKRRELFLQEDPYEEVK